MARYSQSQHFDFYHTSPNPIDKKPLYSEGDDQSVLDDDILNSNTTDMAQVAASRRASDVYSPSEATSFPDFPQPPSNHLPNRPLPQQHHGMFGQGHNGFVRLEASQPTHFGGQHPQASWGMPAESGSCTPTAMFEPFPAEYEHQQPEAYQSAMGSVGFGIPFRPNNSFAPQGGVPMSPQSSQGWLSAASSDPADAGSLPKRLRHNSPPFHRPTSPFRLHRDGIRKKNARFEIPAERTLSTIDVLIEKSTDDVEIKELKAQKRLLRNRQAAYVRCRCDLFAEGTDLL